jgi:acetolactate synthase regulatory subunit
MDRTEEFASVLKVYGYDGWETREVSMAPLTNPEFASISLDVAKSIRNNESLLKRIDKLYVSIQVSRVI